jgi:Fic-DOC domain mobile mystery protein B
LKIRIHTQDELNVLEFENISKATAKYLVRRPSQAKVPFTYEWFLKLHREMYEDVWEWAGKFRQTNKNIGIDKFQMPEALKNLEKDYQAWKTSKMDPDEVAARLHHRLVWIHPFENGNGRWARLIVNIYLKQNEHPLIIWPAAELLSKTDVRQRYLKALRQADEHAFQSLIELQKELQA